MPPNWRHTTALWLPAYLCLLVFVLPLATGSETLFLRDVFNTHLPMKVGQAEAFRAGYLPLIDLNRAGGQPALGNPNNVVWYPTSVLTALLPPLYALNLHFVIHVLVAPFAMFWLCRRLGLERHASCAAGMLYTTSGFYFSQLNFVNLVAGASLTPALVAAALATTDTEARRRTRGFGVVALALLWGLLLVSGDPLSALQALCLATLAFLLYRGWRPLGQLARSLSAPVCAGVVGTLLAAPQLLEFRPVLESSFRGLWGFSSRWALTASLDPRTLPELLIPMVFGRPDLAFWGSDFFDQRKGLFYTLYPGVLLLALVVAAVFVTSGRGAPAPSTNKSNLRRASRFGWLAVVSGTFLALGRYNPLILAWVEAGGGGQVLRFPIKFWLLAAVGLGVLAGVAWQQVFATANQNGTDEIASMKRGSPARALGPVLLGLLALYVGLWVWARFFGSGIEAFVAAHMPAGLPDELPATERARVALLALYNAGLLCVYLGAMVLARRRAVLAGALVLTLHASSQLALLAPVVPTEPTIHYTSEPPPILASIERNELVVHSSAGAALFDEGENPAYGDPSAHWVQRRGRLELYPSYGVLHGVRYDLNTSPDGLDSFLTFTTGTAFGMLDDLERVRLLRAVGVDALVIDRRLAEDAERVARLRARHDSFGSNIWVYSLPGAAREVELVGSVRRAPHMNAGIEGLIAPDFDARRMVILPGQGPPLDAPAGEARIVARGPEKIVVRTRSEFPNVLVWRRAWQPMYRATSDGTQTEVLVANQTRIGIEVPAGEHEVVIETDRRRLDRGLLASLVGLVALFFLPRSLPTNER